ncbi:uncharacterized protein C7orf62 homolog [Arapaima gigas]
MAFGPQGAQAEPLDDGGPAFEETESLFAQVLDSCRVLRKVQGTSATMPGGKRVEKPIGSKEKSSNLFDYLWGCRLLLNPQDEMKFLLHRLVAVGSLSPGLADNRELGAHCERLNQRVQRSHQGDAITGLLLLYPSYMVLIAECSSEALVSVLQDLRNLQTRPPSSALIVQARILVVSHDLPGRLFQQWSFRVLTPPAQTPGNRPEHEPTEKLVADTLTQLMKLGNCLRETPKDLKAAQETPLDQMPELLVSQEVLGQLLEREELLTPLQYLQTYHSPVNVLLDSGHSIL